MVSRCCGGSQTPTLNCKFPMAQILIQSGMSPSGIWVLWWLTNPYFESQIPNGSKSDSDRDVHQWYMRAPVATKPVLSIANCQWFKIAGCPPVVFGCSGGSKTRTLYRKLPMLQSLIQPGMSPSGIWVLRWLKNQYFVSQIPNSSNSHTNRIVPKWYLGATVPHNPVL